MKKITYAGLFGLMAIAAIVSCKNETKVTANTEITQDSLIRRGDYLVATMGCDDCHSPKKMGPKGPEIDMDRRLSGHPADMKPGKVDLSVMKEGWVLFNMQQTAAVGPWGMSFAANITSDNTGIGDWSEEQFFKAMKHGKYKGLDGSRPLLPPMPWQAFTKMHDNDLKAIFAYLKSTKPVENLVPSAKPITEL